MLWGRHVTSRHRIKHQSFVETTKKILTQVLTHAESYPVGSWLGRYTRPDLFIVQHSALGREIINGKESWIATYDRYFIVECKVSLTDIPNAAFQLMIALVSIRSLEDLDFHHGGLAPILAIPTELKNLAKKRNLLAELQDILRELYFGLVVVDNRTGSIEWLLPPSSL
jgi:hypothetical protein